MITMSYEAFFALVAICCGAGYMLGKDLTQKSNCPQPMEYSYFS